MPDYLPRPDAAFRTWTQSFLRAIAAMPSDRLPPAQAVSDYAVAVAAFDEAYTRVCDPATQSPIATRAKNETRATLEAMTRTIAKGLRSQGDACPLQLHALGLRLRAKQTRRAAPTTWPMLEIVATVNATVTLRAMDSSPTNRLGKPVSADALILLSFAGEQPPHTPAGWRMEQMTGRPRFDFTPRAELAPGTRLWLIAQWKGHRGTFGPLGPAMSFRVAEGGRRNAMMRAA